MALIDTLGKSAGGVFNRTLGRLLGSGLKAGAESSARLNASAQWGDKDKNDWRVKLSVPVNNTKLYQDMFQGNTILAPIAESRGIIFPLTPSVLIQHQASYNPMSTTHSNYPFYAYQHSETSTFTCIGEFPVQNYQDAQNWVASLHFLRTVTKMFFGGTEASKGNPPPVLKFNGYGDYVFKNVPVVVTNFTVELTANVDYISTTRGQKYSEYISQGDGIDDENVKIDTKTSMVPTTYAPTLSLFNVQLQPVYSREALTNFSLEEFARGNLNNIKGKNQEGFGFI